MKSGKEWVGFYYNGRDEFGKRIQIPLGTDPHQARLKWAELESVNGLDKTSVALFKRNQEIIKRSKNETTEQKSRRWLVELIDVCSATRARAKHKGMEFSLLPEDLLELFMKNHGRCALSGIPFSTRWETGHRIRIWYPSVDRIDSTKGYHLENVRLVCAYVNVILNQFGEDLLIAVAKKIAVHVADRKVSVLPDDNFDEAA